MSESVLNTTNNIYVVSGDKLTPLVGDVDLYDYDYISFKDCDINVFEEGKTDRSYTELKKELENKGSRLYVFSLADASPKDQSIIGASRWNDYKGLSSCIVSASGAVVPRPYIPGIIDATPLMDNGIYNSEDSSNKSIVENGINWYTKRPIQDAGERKDNKLKAGYIDMTSAITENEREIIEGDGKFAIKRRYYPNFMGNEIGAFALICNFVEIFPQAEKENVPKIVLSINHQIPSTADSETLTTQISIMPSEGVIAQISGFGSAIVHGSLSRGESKIKPPQCEGIEDFNNAYILYIYPVYNGLVITSDILDGIKSSNTLFVPMKNDVSYVNELKNPDISEFPAYFQEHIDTIPKVSLKINERYDNCFLYDNSMLLSWTNAIGAFAYCPLQFSTIFKMRYYFLGQQSLIEDTTINYYAVPIYFRNGSKYHINNIDKEDPELIEGYEIGKEVISGISFTNGVFAFDFNIKSSIEIKATEEGKTEVDSYTAKLRPIELYGFVFIKRLSGSFNNMSTEDGEFDCDSNITSELLENLYSSYGARNSTSGIYNNDNDWMEYITDINVQHSIKGTSGGFTLDKYSMMKNLYDFPSQSIGALTLCVKNGPHGNVEFSHSVYDNTNDGQVFKGYAMEIANNVSSAPEMNVQLEGINKKLEDIKLIHAPFWDGNQVFGDSESGNGTDVLSFFRNYTGCRIRCSEKFTKTDLKDVRLPRSYTYTNPSTYFKNGTTCLSALEDIAEKINHQFIIQPNGVGYFYEMNDYGLPYWLYDDDNSSKMNYSKSDIISFSVKPNLENRFNYVLTIGLIKQDKNNEKIDDLGWLPQVRDNNLGDINNGFPWSRIIVNGFPGVLNKNEFEKLHSNYIKNYKTELFSGSISVPGYPYFFILDIITIDGIKYYIDGISHTISLTSKTWTTNLNINPLPLL